MITFLHRFLLFSALLCTHITMYAQDLHFSQFYNNPQHLNPALTGVFAGSWRANAQYRSQWETVPVQYRTIAGGFEWKAIQRPNSMVALGLLLQNDAAGDATLRWNQVGVNISIAQMITSRQAISVGFGTAVVQRSFNISGLTFQNQWDGDIFDGNRPSREQLNQSSGLSPSLSAGINWHYGASDNGRTRIDFGAGAFHLNKVNVNFKDDATYTLPVRIAVQANSAIKVRQDFDLVGFALYQSMTRAQEILVGGGVRYWLSDVPGNRLATQLTLATRAGDALIPALQVEYNAWLVGLSYDWNISRFEIATQGRGGFELSVAYRSMPVSKMPVFKACPIF